MREAILHHFDVLVVVWVLALAVGWSVVALTHSQLTNDQWSSAPHAGPVWVIPAGN